jgi:hypothetical protein
MNSLQPLLAESIPVLIPLLIPIFGIVFGCSIAIVAIYTQYRQQKDAFALYHQERMAAIEKGIELPPAPEGLLDEAEKPAHPRRLLLTGLVWLFIGVGLVVALHFHLGRYAWYGLIPAGIGLAYLIYYAVAGKKEAELADAAAQAKLAETGKSPRL